MPRLEKAVARLGGICVESDEGAGRRGIRHPRGGVGATRVQVEGDALMAFREDPARARVRCHPEEAGRAQSRLGGDHGTRTRLLPRHCRDSSREGLPGLRRGARGRRREPLAGRLPRRTRSRTSSRPAARTVPSMATGEVIESPPPKSFWESPEKQLPQVLQLVAADARSFAGVIDQDFQRLHVALRTSPRVAPDVPALVEKVKTYAAQALFGAVCDVQMTGTLVVMASISSCRDRSRVPWWPTA